MYYSARYYSPEVRVFTQPDTMLPNPYDPQALNRYSYCLNNPVRYTDPSGHVSQAVVIGIVSAGVGVLSLVASVGLQAYVNDWDVTKVDYWEATSVGVAATAGTAVAGITVAAGSVAATAGPAAAAPFIKGAALIDSFALGGQATIIASNALSENHLFDDTVADGNYNQVTEDVSLGVATWGVGSMFSKIKYVARAKFPQTAKGADKAYQDITRNTAPAVNKIKNSNTYNNYVKPVVEEATGNAISNAITNIWNRINKWYKKSSDKEN
jgi:hypothetical protein